MSVPLKKDIFDPAALVELYGDVLYKKAFQLVRRREVAEDLVQETFLSVLKERKALAECKSIDAWLLSIVKNKSFDYLRRRILEEKLFDTESLDSEDSSYFNIFGIWKSWTSFWSSSPDKFSEMNGFVKQLDSCVTKLPSAHRAFFNLKFAEELSTDELCNRLNISQANAWILLYRTRMKLRACMDKNWFNV